MEGADTETDLEPIEQPHVYEDKDGNPLRKTQWFRRADGSEAFCQFCHTSEGWEPSVDGVKEVPYRLPQLTEAIGRQEPVFIVEGESCVDSLETIGVVATTNVGGAGKWPESFQEYFGDALVVLLPNNDKEGRQHMAQVAANLEPVVSSLRVVELPGLEAGDDASEWIESGGDRQQLRRLVNATEGRVQKPTDEVPAEHSAKKGWEVPLPLDPGVVLPPFPVDVLPPSLSDYVSAVAEATQTPVDLPGVLSLAVIATVVSGLRLRVRPGFEVPLNLYTVTALAVGEGKSPVYRELIQPLEIIEGELQSEAEPRIRTARAEREVALANLAAIQKMIKDDKTAPEERSALRPAVEEAQAELDAILVPVEPRLYAQDATPEGLLKLLNEQGGRMAVLDDEGGELFELLRRYSSSGNANQGVYLHGHDGGRLQSDWSTKEYVGIDTVLLTLGLTVQPGVIHSLSTDPALRTRGLLARFLFSLPGSELGYRNHWTDPVPKELQTRFTEDLRLLTQHSISSNGEPESLMRLGEEGTELFKKWAKDHEARLRPDGDLVDIPDWGNKLPGQLARLIGILQAISQPQNPTAKPVTVRNVERGIELAGYFSDHAKAAFKLMRSDPLVFKAVRVVEWLRGKTKVTQREIHRALPGLFDNVSMITKVVELLVDYGYLRHEKEQTSRKGGRPSKRLLVNPLIH